MNTSRLIPIVVMVAAVAGLATGCVAAPGNPGVTAAETSSHEATAPSTPTTTPSPKGTRPAATPTARPFVSTSTATVSGLDAAIASAPHQALAICEGHFSSVLISASDLRGTGTTQYLTDTTCVGATASTPDEVALYERSSGALARTAVVYEFTENRPRLTSQPYLFGPHTIVLTYDEGADYRLVRVTPTSLVPGLVQRF